MPNRDTELTENDNRQSGRVQGLAYCRAGTVVSRPVLYPPEESAPLRACVYALGVRKWPYMWLMLCCAAHSVWHDIYLHGRDALTIATSVFLPLHPPNTLAPVFVCTSITRLCSIKYSQYLTISLLNRFINWMRILNSGIVLRYYLLVPCLIYCKLCTATLCICVGLSR